MQVHDPLTLPLAVGIVGAGAIVETGHLPVLRATSELSVAWLADVNLGKARALGAAHKVKAVDLNSGAASLPPADVILLAIPLGARAPYYEVLRSGSSAVYVEKPLARSFESHLELCSWFEDYRLGCGFQRRSSGPNQFLRRLIKERVFGDLRLVRFGWGGPGSSGGDGFLSDLRLAGGGVLAEQAVHGIDAMLFCTGAEAIEVRKAKMATVRNFDVHSEARVSLHCDGSSVDCEITVSLLRQTINRTEYQWDHALVLHTFDDLLHLATVDGETLYQLQPPRGMQYPVGSYQCFYQHWQNFILGIREKRANWTSAARALTTTQLIEAIYQAAAPLEKSCCPLQ
jgi:predicted dehydrogenase